MGKLLGLLGVLLCLLAGGSAQAQETPEAVVIKLKNGNILKGKLLQYRQLGYELQLSGSTVVHIPLSDVEEVKTLAPAYGRRIYAGVQLGLLFGLRENQGYQNILVAPSVQLSAGYKWKHWLQAGIGSGHEQFGKIGVIPLYGELQGTILKEGSSPYYSLKLGKGFAEVKDDFRYQDARGGLMGEAQAGISFRFTHFNWLIGSGYHFQKVRLEGSSPGWGGENKRVQHRELRRMLFTTAVRFSF